MEAKMEPKWGLESIFIAIENDVKKVMLFREGLEGLGRGRGARQKINILLQSLIWGAQN